jgi:hypothetical protein
MDFRSYNKGNYFDLPNLKVLNVKVVFSRGATWSRTPTLENKVMQLRKWHRQLRIEPLRSRMEVVQPRERYVQSRMEYRQDNLSYLHDSMS